MGTGRLPRPPSRSSAASPTPLRRLLRRHRALRDAHRRQALRRRDRAPGSPTGTYTTTYPPPSSVVAGLPAELDASSCAPPAAIPTSGPLTPSGSWPRSWPPAGDVGGRARSHRAAAVDLTDLDHTMVVPLADAADGRPAPSPPRRHRPVRTPRNAAVARPIALLVILVLAAALAAPAGTTASARLRRHDAVAAELTVAQAKAQGRAAALGQGGRAPSARSSRRRVVDTDPGPATASTRTAPSG
jgi:hypothetical protein